VGVRGRRFWQGWAFRTCVLVALPVVLLWPWRHIGVVSDDIYVVRTPFSLDPVRLLRGDDWTHAPLAGTRAWRPVTVATFALTHAIAGPSAPVYRLTNFALHGLVCALVACVTWRLTASRAAAWAAGVLFALHPVHHENVLWIAGRTHVVSALLSLAALSLVLTPRRASSRSRAAAVGVASAGALLAYEPAVILPVLIVAVLLVAGDGTVGQRLVAAWRQSRPVWAATAAVLVLRWLLLVAPASDVHAFLSPRAVINGAGAVGRWLALPRGPAGPLLLAPVVVLSALASGGLLWVGCRRPETRRALLAGGALAAVALVPFLPLPGYSDRFNYLPSAGFVIALAAAFGVTERGRRAAAIGLAIILSVVWVRTLLVTATQWETAGRIATALRAQLQEAADLRGARRVTFFCVPDFYGTATLYLTYFEQDVRDALAGAAPEIARRRDGVQVSAEQVLADAPAGDLAYRWNSAAWRLERLDALAPEVRQAPVCIPAAPVARP
jgi:hypothetical protein